MTNRLFIALEIPENVLDKVITIRDEIYGEDRFVRWEGKEKLHITLKFLGDVEESKTELIIDALKETANKYRKIKCSFNKFGIFFKDHILRILWGEIEYENHLNDIVNEIEDRMEKIGFSKEKRRFKAHFTILRIKGREDKEKINKFVQHNFDKIDYTAENISLIKSELLPKGSVYKRIETFKLI
ncbi:MAG: RNA 2',3'-cyclic phosphodiesterase [bacterium]